MLVTRSATSKPVDKYVSMVPVAGNVMRRDLKPQAEGKRRTRIQRQKQSRAFHIKRWGHNRGKTSQDRWNTTSQPRSACGPRLNANFSFRMDAGRTSHQGQSMSDEARPGESRAARESLSCSLPATHARSRCLICGRTMAFWCWLTHMLPKPPLCLYSPSTYGYFV